MEVLLVSSVPKKSEYAKRQMAARDARRRAEHQERGLCVQCDNPAVPGRVKCVACRDKGRLWAQTRRDARLCMSCGTPLDEDDSGRACKLCCLKRKLRRKGADQERVSLRRLHGLCPNCGRKSKRGCVSCEMCLSTRRISQPRRMADPEKRAKVNERCRLHRQQVKAEVFAHYGGSVCACCGELTPQFLTIDHMNNDGAAHRMKIFGKKAVGGYHLCLWLRSAGYPDGFQILCFNCNCAKGFWGVCPHVNAQK